MSVDTLEDTDLSNINLDEDPPCEVLVPVNFRTECGKPSIHRVRTTCLTCDSVSIRFYCSQHFDDLRQGSVACGVCTRAYIRKWEVI